VKPSPIYLPLAVFYGAGVAARNALYAFGVLGSHRVTLPVVSVGNLSAGGTGKTPFVVLLVEELSRRGIRVAVVARGYGRKSKGTVVVGDNPDARRTGDEPAMIARRVRATVVVDDSKLTAARWVAGQRLADVVVVDDGFQHRALHRDLDIVLLTQEETHRGGCLLPAGYRREPLAALKRAHLVALTGCADSGEFRQASSKLAWLGPVPRIGATLKLESVLDASTERPLELSGRRVLALSGIGNPLSFERTLQDLGAVVLGHQAYPDHHWFAPTDLEKAAAAARSLGAEYVVTTEKDLVRISPLAGALAHPLAVVRVRCEIVSGREILDEHVGRIVAAVDKRN